MARLHTASTTARGATISFIGGIEWLLRAVVINAFNFQDTRYGFSRSVFSIDSKKGLGVRGNSWPLDHERRRGEGKADEDDANKLQLFSAWFAALSTHAQA